ncbi:MAG: hypothetical protein JF595_06025 [Sphingomonadales bacterium]|nr:hypothetical protein [Sphingomonadales bacterium]
MTSDEYPDLCVTEAVLDGLPPLAFDDDDEEADENEISDSSVGYGSLLSLGASMRRKQPLIVVDPIEAENEARRVQFIAAQQLVDPDEGAELDFLEGPADFAEPDMREADVPGEEMRFAYWQSAANEAGKTAVRHADEPGPDPWAPFDVSEERIRIADGAIPDEAADIDAVVPAAELVDSKCEPICAEPSPAQPRHSLRARMPARQAPKTLADHASALLAWLRDWLGWSRI